MKIYNGFDLEFTIDLDDYDYTVAKNKANNHWYIVFVSKNGHPTLFKMINWQRVTKYNMDGEYTEKQYLNFKEKVLSCYGLNNYEDTIGQSTMDWSEENWNHYK